MQITSRLNPFTSKTDTRFYPAGMTISELLDFVGVGRRLRKHCRVTISGNEISKEYWNVVRPKEGTKVDIVATPQGGGGGGKGVLGIVLVIAAIAIYVFAPYLAPTLALEMSSTATISSGVAFAATVATATTYIGYAATALAMVGLSMLSSSSSKGLSSASATGATTSNTYKLTGSSNQVNKWGVIPRVYGKHKVTPVVCANTFTETAGDDEYLNMLFTFGYGPITIEDLRIGTNPIDWYEEVEYEYREGWSTDDPITLYKNSVLQDSYSVDLKYNVPRTFRSRVDADEISFDIYFNQGLTVYNTTTGNADTTSVSFLLEYRKVGDTDWSVIEGNSTQCTDYETSYVFSQDFRNSSGTIIYPAGSTVSITTWPIDVWLNTDDGLILYATAGSDVSSYAITTSEICVETKSIHTVTDASTSAFTYNARFIAPSNGQYDIRVTRLTADPTTTNVKTTSLFTVLRTFKYVNPVNMTGISLLALRIKATNQLNGVVDELNAIAYGHVKTWDGETLSDWVPSRNPAWAYLDALIGPACKNPVDITRIDMDKLLAWANDCDELDTSGNPMYQFDAVIDYATTTFELLNVISTVGRGSFGTRAGKFSVTRDEPQTIVRDIYTPRNTHSFKGYKSLYDMPHAVRGKWVSPDLDYEQDEVIVYAAGYDETTATRFEEVEWFGITTYSQAYRMTAYYLACILLRPESYEVNVSLDGFVVERGDLINLAHDVPLVGGTPALIKNVVLDGDNITHIVLDDFVSMEAGNEYGLKVRDLEGNTSTYAIVTEEGETKTIELVTPVNKGTVSKSQSIAVFGIYSEETIQCLVSKITRDVDLTAKITLVPYNDAVYTADSEEIPPYDPQINTNADNYVPSIVRELSITESYSGGKVYTVSLNLSWQAPLNGKAFSYEVYRLVNGSYKLQDVIDSKSWTYNSNVAIGNSYTFAVVAVAPSGRKLPVSQAASIVHSVTGFTPSDVSNFDGDVVDNNIVLTWDMSDETYVYDYIIRHSTLVTGANWSASVDLQSVSSPTKTCTLPAQTGTYLIKARDYLGNESPNAKSVINTVSRDDEINVVQTIDESSWLGSCDDVIIVDGALRLGDSAYIFDDVIDVDSLSDFDSLDAPFVYSGTYYFYNTVDLGAVYTSRLSSTITVDGIDYNELIDTWLDVDSRSSWDDDPPSQYSVNLYIRTTEDDPGSSPIWSDWKLFTVSSYKARAFEFKLVLLSTQENVTPSVSELAVTIDMPDRIERFSNLVSGTGTYIVTYSYPFWGATDNPTVTITAGNMDTGDYYIIENRTNAGFDITFYNSSNVIVSRQFDVLAAGFGREI